MIEYEIELKENYNKIIKVTNDNLLECLKEFEKKIFEVYNTSTDQPIMDKLASEIAFIFNQSAINIAISLQKLIDKKE